MLTEEDFYDLRRRHQRRRLDGTYRDNPQLNLDIDILIDTVGELSKILAYKSQTEVSDPDEFDSLIKHFKDF